MSYIATVKRAIRSLQGWMERHLIGGLVQEWSWRLRHLYKKQWAENYQQSINHPHRDQIVETVLHFDPVDAVLEVGCASGANLIRLRENLPRTKLIGVDLNREGIRIAIKYFERMDQRVELMVGRADRLDRIPDQSVDVVLADAVLMFVTPDTIDQVISEFIRVSRKGIVLNEYNMIGQINGLFDGGRWVYDFSELVKKAAPQAIVIVHQSQFTGGLWDQYGAVIEVKL